MYLCVEVQRQYKPKFIINGCLSMQLRHRVEPARRGAELPPSTYTISPPYLYLPSTHTISTVMSAPSGIKVPASIGEAFSAAHSNGEDVRALVFVIEGGECPIPPGYRV